MEADFPEAAAEEEVVEVSNSSSHRPADRYGSNQIRPGLLPGLLGAAAAIAGLWANGTEWMITVLFAVSIMAAVLVVFCVQSVRSRTAPSAPQRARRSEEPTQQKFVPVVCAVLLVVVVVVYNPIAPLVLTASGTAWQLAQVATGAVLFATGVLVKTSAPER